MTHLAVIRGLTYTNRSQVLNRWLMPIYKTALRWTGNRADGEDAARWVFLSVADQLRLPELVKVVDEHVVDLGREAITRHWVDRYGIARVRCTVMCVSEEGVPLDALFDDLTAEMRLVLVLRFLRERSSDRIASQLGIRSETARQRIVSALGAVARRIGLPVESGMPPQVDRVSNYVDDVVARRRPVRFGVQTDAWPALIAAGHMHAAIAGNDLPAKGFVRSLQERFMDHSERRLVTHLRIWSA